MYPRMAGPTNLGYVLCLIPSTYMTCVIGGKFEKCLSIRSAGGNERWCYSLRGLVHSLNQSIKIQLSCSNLTICV